MKEYIEREAVFKELDSLKADIKLTMLGVYKAVDVIPAADVAPIVHGEWIEHPHFAYGGSYNGSSFECSICHCDELWDIDEYNYCPNCGARMDGGNK